MSKPTASMVFSIWGIAILCAALFLLVFPASALALTAPTLVDYDQSNWTDTNNTPEVTGSITWQAGDLVVVFGATGNGNERLALPIASGLVFATTTYLNTGASETANYLWVATAASGGSGTVTSNELPDNFTGTRGISAFVYRGSDGIGNTSTLSGQNWLDTDLTKTRSLTRNFDNSAVIISMSDWTAGSDVLIDPSPAGGTQRVAIFVNGQVTNYIFDWGDQGAAGSTNYGITNHASSTHMNVIVAEIKGSAAAPVGRVIRLVGHVRLVGGVRLGGSSPVPRCATGFTMLGNGSCRMFITTTGAGTFTVPSNWNSSNNYIEAIGGGGGGCGNPNACGGGGGEYRAISNFSASPGANISVVVGAGGAGIAAGINPGGYGASSTFNGTSLVAGGGYGGVNGGTLGGQGGHGGTGAAANFNGGDGGEGPNTGGGGGGGAGGPLGAGGNGGDGDNGGGGCFCGGGGGGNGGGASASDVGSGASVGTDGGNNASAAGGGAHGAPPTGGSNGGGGGGADSGTYNGGAGGNGTEWGSVGSGGGGGGGSGGGSTQAGTGGNGGQYGGGGGGEADQAFGGKGGDGADGIIVITYTP